MNDAIVAGKGLPVKQRCERLALGRVFAAGSFAFKGDEAAAGKLHDELSPGGILRRDGKAHAVK